MDRTFNTTVRESPQVKRKCARCSLKLRWTRRIQSAAQTLSPHLELLLLDGNVTAACFVPWKPPLFSLPPRGSVIQTGCHRRHWIKYGGWYEGFPPTDELNNGGAIKKKRKPLGYHRVIILTGSPKEGFIWNFFVFCLPLSHYISARTDPAKRLELLDLVSQTGRVTLRWQIQINLPP